MDIHIPLPSIPAWGWLIIAAVAGWLVGMALSAAGKGPGGLVLLFVLAGLIVVAAIGGVLSGVLAAVGLTTLASILAVLALFSLVASISMFVSDRKG